ncbi:MAG: helix-turn-helix domain-containing protein [Pseudolysinimonas sp.]
MTATQHPLVGKAERTRAHIFATALELFEAEGFEAVTVARIAEHAGVSEMTFFRHFATKDALLLDDPYDPLIVAAVAAQPRDLPPIRRAVAGIRDAWAEFPIEQAEEIRRRLRVASSPALRLAVSRNTATTERVVAEQLERDGADPASARVAAAAVLAALMAALLHWAQSDAGELGTAIGRGLDVLEGRS